MAFYRKSFLTSDVEQTLTRIWWKQRGDFSELTIFLPLAISETKVVEVVGGGLPLKITLPLIWIWVNPLNGWMEYFVLGTFFIYQLSEQRIRIC